MRRAIRAAVAEGLLVERIDVSTDGRASIVTSGKQEVAQPEINEWDRDLDGPRR
jgi:hypothetical protein